MGRYIHVIATVDLFDMWNLVDKYMRNDARYDVPNMLGTLESLGLFGVTVKGEVVKWVYF